jgi:hypothetical protein
VSPPTLIVAAEIADGDIGDRPEATRHFRSRCSAAPHQASALVSPPPAPENKAVFLGYFFQTKSVVNVNFAASEPVRGIMACVADENPRFKSE